MNVGANNEIVRTIHIHGVVIKNHNRVIDGILFAVWFNLLYRKIMAFTYTKITLY